MKTLDRWKHRPEKRTGAAYGSKSSNKAAQRGIAYHRKFYRYLRQRHTARYPDQDLLIEPWFQNVSTGRFRSPDTVIVDPTTNTGIVIEVKMNWKQGRDQKLIDEYLPIVKSAFDLDCVWPLVVTSNVRGFKGKTLLFTPNLAPLEECLAWQPADLTPVALYI